MLVQTFHHYLKIEKQFTEHTRIAYAGDLEQLEAYLQEQWYLSLDNPTQVKKISHKHLRGWMAHLMSNGQSARTTARKLSAAKSYFAFLQKGGHIEANPASRLHNPKQKKRLPAYLKESETTNLFEEISFPQNFEGARDRCLLEILYGCGLRRAELMGLKPTDVDLYSQQIRVLGKGNKERIVPYGQHVQNALEDYLRYREQAGFGNAPFLFLRKDGKKLYPKLVYRLVQKYLNQVSSSSKTSPHVLRHTFATHLLNNGADLNAIKELLGHASLASTQVYTHNSIKKLKDIHHLAHPRARNHNDP